VGVGRAGSNVDVRRPRAAPRACRGTFGRAQKRNSRLRPARSVAAMRTEPSTEKPPPCSHCAIACASSRGSGPRTHEPAQRPPAHACLHRLGGRLRHRRGRVEGGATQVGLETLPESMAGACDWELWHYSPALVRDIETVDPHSLTLSLQGNQDERVQLALDELEGRFPW